ncbi:MAG: triose-phosphate isomerase, partial [Planctomycetes bacterium]|nr:triose-phosphate isomerase [Planctomycetota bacterium]
MNQPKPYVAGNWKMHLTREQAFELALGVGMLADRFSGVDLAVFPGFLVLGEIARGTAGSDMIVGAQNCHFLEEGAATGEVSPKQLYDVGVRSVLIGHSERRTFAHEDNELLSKKVLAAIQQGLDVIFCVGESSDQREAGETAAVVTAQLEVLSELPESKRVHVDIAYEPIWAIGTGQVATPEQAAETHLAIRTWLDGAGGFEGTRVL